MTPLGRAVLVTSFLFYLVAVINQNDGAFVVCWSAVSIVIACFLLSRASLSGVRVRCDCHDRRAFEGQEVRLRIQLDNRGSLNKTNIGLVAQFHNVTQGVSQQPTYQAEILESRGHLEGTARLNNLRRGHHRLTELKAVGGDPIGLFRTTRRILTDASFLVYPRVFTIHDELRRSGNHDRQPGRPDVSGRQAGPSTEFFGTREYYPGDDLRWVHWASTARRGRLVLREFEAAVHGSAVVWVDLWSEQCYGAGEDSSLEWQLRIAASLLHHQLSAGRTIGLVCTSSPPTIVPISRGHTQIGKSLEALATAEANGRCPLHEALTRLPGASLGSTTILITASVREVTHAIPLLRKRQADGIVIVLDPSSFDLEISPSVDLPGAAESANQLKRAGIDAVVFRRGDDVRALLARCDSKQRSRFQPASLLTSRVSAATRGNSAEP